MFKKLLLASVLAVPAVSMAEGLSYSYAEAAYVTVDADGGGEADGFNVGGSFLVSPMVFISGDYSMLDVDGGGDFDIGNIGAGLRHALTPTLDAVVGADLVFVDVGSDDDTGYRVRGGLRAALGAAELNGGIAYRDVFNDGQTVFSVGGLYSFTPNIAALAGAEFDEDTTSFKIGGRYMF